MFCPDCRTEYRDGFTHCSDCGAALVERLIETEPQMESEDIQLVNVFRASGQLEADLIRSLLEANGIDAYPSTEEYALTVGDIEIAVTAEQEESARRVIEEHKAGADKEEESIEPD